MKCSILPKIRMMGFVPIFIVILCMIPAEFDIKDQIYKNFLIQIL